MSDYISERPMESSMLTPLASPQRSPTAKGFPKAPATAGSPESGTKRRALMENYVKKMGGKRTLHRILIANNGMAATKAIQSMRQWAYMVLGENNTFNQHFMRCISNTK